jgi:hypothetical protein
MSINKDAVTLLHPGGVPRLARWRGGCECVIAMHGEPGGATAQLMWRPNPDTCDTPVGEVMREPGRLYDFVNLPRGLLSIELHGRTAATFLSIDAFPNPKTYIRGES